MKSSSYHYITFLLPSFSDRHLLNEINSILWPIHCTRYVCANYFCKVNVYVSPGPVVTFSNIYITERKLTWWFLDRSQFSKYSPTSLSLSTPSVTTSQKIWSLIKGRCFVVICFSLRFSRDYKFLKPFHCFWLSIPTVSFIFQWSRSI